MLRTLILILIIGLNSFYLVSCSQEADSPNVTENQKSPTQVTASPSNNVVPTKPAPTPTSRPIPTATPRPIPTATPRPIPTATPIPIPTATPIPLIATTILDSFGFKLLIDGVITIENTGFIGTEANNADGIVYFEYDGANSTLLWFEDNSSNLEDILFDSYNSIVEANQDLSFTLINQGEMNVESSKGQFLTYVSTNSEGTVQGGGLTGSWRCQANESRATSTIFSLTVTGADPVVLQIRFKRLIDNFNCIP